MRILSGIQPSGRLHIGNYLAMIRPMIEYQDRGELFCFIANLHSLTSVFDGDVLREYTIEALLDLSLWVWIRTARFYGFSRMSPR